MEREHLSPRERLRKLGFFEYERGCFFHRQVTTYKELFIERVALDVQCIPYFDLTVTIRTRQGIVDKYLVKKAPIKDIISRAESYIHFIERGGRNIW